MSNRLKIYLIAGEPSGDALGGRLMSAMKKKTKGNIEFFGLGGENMESEGLKSIFDISELSIMGIAEVIPSIPRVLKRIKQTVDDILRIHPDIVVTIDSWSFASRVQEKLRAKKVNIPQVHYVAPQVWAWKKKRAKTMHKYVDCLLTLLPYEAKYFIPHGLKTVPGNRKPDSQRSLLLLSPITIPSWKTVFWMCLGTGMRTISACSLP